MSTWYTVDCRQPLGVEPALISYEPDTYDEDGRSLVRSWRTARAFSVPPPVPVACYIEEGEGGALQDLATATVWLIHRRLLEVLLTAGVTNLEVFDAEIRDFNTDITHTSHVAANVVGEISKAELDSTSLLAVKLSSGGLAFHASVADAVRAAGFATLEFTPVA